MMFNSILVVCTGNLCRSPLGERLLRHRLPNKIIDSAGTAALAGHRADADAARVAQKNGLSLEGHHSHQFTADMSAKYDLILVMEKEHIRDITRIAPEARSKSMLLGYWANHTEIPDPWRKSDEAFDHVFHLIDHACQAWASKLLS
jgi:protein-tyrosine phosphatase